VSSLKFFTHFGSYLLMLRSAFARPEKWRMYWNETVRQMNDIGVGSVIIVALVSVFVGAVAAVQFSYQLGGQLIPRYYIGYIVRDLCIIELSPTVSCLAKKSTLTPWKSWVSTRRAI
jgi:phospholipid/cholesterol/gamma-HCH transport system permease protein